MATNTERPLLPLASPVFFLVMRQGETFQKVSPFLIHKLFVNAVGEPKQLKRLRDGSLFIECVKASQGAKLSGLTKLGDFPIVVEPHRQLNTSRGVVSSWDLLDLSEEELLEGLKDQNVVQVRRITRKKDGQIEKTTALILTFGQPELPQRVRAGYLSLPVRPYIPQPMRCFKCQRFGHVSANCKQASVCGNCAQASHQGEPCTAGSSCINCGGSHPSWVRTCPKYQEEMAVQKIRTEQKVSAFEARRIAAQQNPSRSYANVVRETQGARTEQPLKFNQTQLKIIVKENMEAIIEILAALYAETKEQQVTETEKTGKEGAQKSPEANTNVTSQSQKEPSTCRSSSKESKSKPHLAKKSTTKSGELNIPQHPRPGPKPKDSGHPESGKARSSSLSRLSPAIRDRSPIDSQAKRPLSPRTIGLHHEERAGSRSSKKKNKNAQQDDPSMEL